jgi:hypothetical protein
MQLAGFEPTIPASEWLQTHALDRAATGSGPVSNAHTKNYIETKLLNQFNSSVIYLCWLINPLKTKRVCFI